MVRGRTLSQHIGDLAAGDPHVRPGSEPRANMLEQLRGVRRQTLALARAAGRIEQIVQKALSAGQSGKKAQHDCHRIALIAATFDEIASDPQAAFRRPTQRMRAPDDSELDIRGLLGRHSRDKARLGQEAMTCGCR